MLPTGITRKVARELAQLIVERETLEATLNRTSNWQHRAVLRVAQSQLTDRINRIVGP